MNSTVTTQDSSSPSSTVRHRRRFIFLLSVVLGVVAAFLALLWSTYSGSVLSEPDGSIRSVELREAYLMELGRVADGEQMPPSLGAEGTLVRLPHRLAQGELRYVNYRIKLDVPAMSPAGDMAALCVPRWSSGATVWLDGQLLRKPNPAGLGLSDIRRPEFVALPLGLGAGTHVLDIRVRAVPGVVSGLSPVWFGDSTALRDGCHTMLQQQRDASVGNVFLMVFMGLIAVAIAVLRRDRMALYFAMFSAAWCAHHIFLLAQWPSMSESTWVAYFYTSRPLLIMPLILFLSSLSGQSNPGLQRVMLMAFALAYAVFAVVPAVYLPLWLVCFGLVLVLLLLVSLTHLVRYGFERQLFSLGIFVAALVLGTVSTLVDVARALDWLPWTGRSVAFLAVPLLAVGMGVTLLERLLDYISVEERSALKLREEVARQRAKLASDFLKLQEQAEKIAVLEERKRIVRDMHDGLGSQLVSASALLRSAPDIPSSVTALIDLAIQELRGVLDVLSVAPNQADPDDDPVSMLLGKLRHRLGPVFRAQGIEFGWQTDSLPSDFLTSDEMRLQLLRFMQEAFANVLKHSGARHVELRTHVFNGRIVIDVRDDGNGFDVEQVFESSSAGHGLISMRQRAQDMGAALKITRLYPGTSVRLTFPWS